MTPDPDMDGGVFDEDAFQWEAYEQAHRNGTCSPSCPICRTIVVENTPEPDDDLPVGHPDYEPF